MRKSFIVTINEFFRFFLGSGRKLGNVGNLGFFFRLFLFRLSNFGLILKIENSEEGNSENKFRRFRRFRVFDLPLLSLFSVYTLCFFCFLFLLCLNLLFYAIGLRLPKMQIYVQSGTNKEQCVLYLFKVKKAHQIDISDRKIVFDLNFDK